jgi:hypothetical protein
MSLGLTNLSAFTLSFGPIPYPVPNFNFAYSAGPDGREFLEGDITKYYGDNPGDAYYIFQMGSGIDPGKDPLFIVAQDVVGFSEAGTTASDAYPNLYYYQSQIAGFPGSLEANLSLQAFKDYVFQQAKTANVDFSQSDIDLIEKGFDAVIARYASVLKDGNLMKLGSNLNGSGDGKDYIDMWADIVGVETKDFYNVAPGFTGLPGNPQTNIISAERFDVYGKIFEKATTDGSDYYQWYVGSGDSAKKFTVSDFNVYSQPSPQVDNDGNPTSIVNTKAPTVLQSILGDFKDLLDSGAYSGTFADGGLKIESGVRSLLEAGLDANPLNTGQGYGYSANGSPTAPLGLDSQSILQRIPGYEFSALNTFVGQYGSPVTTIKPSLAALGVNAGAAGAVSALNSDFRNGSGFFPEGSAALVYDSFPEWSIEVVTPRDEFVSQDIFPTPENETLQAIQFFKVEFLDAGLYLEMPETPVKTHIILSSNDVSGDIDEEFALDQESPMIQDLSLGLGEGFSNFAGTSVGDDVVMGGNLNDFIAAKDGNDKVMGMNGDDLIDTGAGYDIAFLGSGSDTILVRHESMKGELAPVSYLTLPDFSSEDVIALEEGIGFEVIDDLRLRLSYEDYEKVVVLSGSSTLKADDSGVLSSSVGWQDIIDMGQIHTV